VASASRHDDECRDEKLDPDLLAYGAAVCVVDLHKVTGEEGDYEWHVRTPRRVKPFAVKGYASIYHVEETRIVYAKPSDEQEARAAIRPRRTVLVAVDDSEMADIVARHLRTSWGDELDVQVVVGDGKKASSFIQRKKPALVLLDEKLSGLSGLEVLSEVRRSNNAESTKVLLMARTTGVNAARQTLGADDAIKMPLELGTLAARAKKLLAK
jgi:CheY-like chemotaxis protein